MDVTLAVIIPAMNVRLIIFSSSRRTCQVRIWPVTESTGYWAKRYDSKSECISELFKLDLLTTQEALDGRDTIWEKNRGNVLSLETTTQRDVLVAAGFTEQNRPHIPCSSHTDREGTGHLDWLP
jgi:hypothetical protein